MVVWFHLVRTTHKRIQLGPRNRQVVHKLIQVGGFCLRYFQALASHQQDLERRYASRGCC